ncbi:hypothetical protein GLOTRDRAFT_113798 [Gloeophyllum trabeum ATCC 11539]|uniref:Uncharacterized protein n=1 Tax=Gloeophyllum trabeum (strain ATCC 11539 / FP-39264 / Madison 617) TaxID=670483 RepID=S7QI84_GLOTA|nr:uncharacterized protein GLOTRDRAFT_113798 [Gloeophyllum trabeum ATCC 11539]EPQ58943.1 hypothetical protein GLOTRDRAFT_113798 [Gloeophyllum trabeum ATCC 11539]
MPRPYARTASLVVSLLGAVGNAAIALQLLSLWRTFKWEFESDWETEGSPTSWLWGIQGVKLAWGLLSVYFAFSAIASIVGFAGILKHRLSFVRFYRDYSIADFAFSTFLTLFATYESFRNSVRAGVCEELSRQPEWLRDMADMGLNLENCELWFERASIALIGVMGIVLIVRLHFLVAVLTYYCSLSRHQQALPIYTSMRPISHTPSAQRVYLLPSPTEETFPVSHHTTSDAMRENNDTEYLVYAPVPLSILSEAQARDLNATEAWLSRAPEATGTASKSRHSHSHSRSHRHKSSGRISLAVIPDEGLLPSYEESRIREVKA